MRQKTLASILLAISSLPCLTFGQTTKEDCRLALDILKGKDKTYDKTWAVHQLEGYVSEQKDAFLLNTLGIAYLHGLGVAPDTVHAISLFEESGANGYALAYHNLGMYYKYNKKGKPDYEKAFEAFEKGAQMESATNQYNCGFMKYKGLGCTQDYVGAVELFNLASKRKNKYALYMLGLCYRNGYGVEQDTAVANVYLRKSANLGLRDAMEELLKEEPEVSSFDWAQVDEDGNYPLEMPDISSYIPANNYVLGGHYKGILVSYDWSGTAVISEKPLSVDLNVERDSAYGQWIQGVDTVPFSACIFNNGVLRFSKGVEKEMYDRYSSTFYSRYRFEQADLNYDHGFITGQLRLYSLSEMEPDRPMYISLKKDGIGDGETEDENSRIMAYVDPASDRVVVKFELSEGVPAVKINVFTQTGVNIGNYKFGEMSAGVNTLSIRQSLRTGYYAIHVNAGNDYYRTIIKK